MNDKNEFRAGIVGSRRRNTLHDRKLVNRLMDYLEGCSAGSGRKLVIVSGGCKQGADTFAAESARNRSIVTKIFLPDDSTPVKGRWDFAQRAFARNRQIAEYSDEVYCLVAPDRKGGTENTIKHANELGRPVYLVQENGDVTTEDGSLLVHLIIIEGP